MFFICKLNQNIFLSPSYLKIDVKKRLTLSLVTTIEGIKLGIFGIIVAIIKLNKFWKKGKIITGSPFILYNISYKAITFKVFKGEVLDSILTNVTELGFFCESGPLQIFVSKQFIPDEYEYDNLNRCFQNRFSRIKIIKNDTIVRVRIIGLRYDSSYTQGLGSIKEPHLGKKIHGT
ncbi:RNA polymerase II RPB7 subunit-like protein (nucleomorph) [Cryptomonas paramecium]|uniref:RNA polymerase II RPB7 subunit-like protein n=1 Tax=Cryptomonas paramaecium TaxID=2898 RepID=F2HHJ7_9CRYP|nr:RNA polymerase II RPB7 subunit-like protein [Cryptomonas paramecium]AEA38793.1 RNA polymerase II RPB7 subunit-like protein [Cryptomonas paramecium]